MKSCGQGLPSRTVRMHLRTKQKARGSVERIGIRVREVRDRSTAAARGKTMTGQKPVGASRDGRSGIQESDGKNARDGSLQERIVRTPEHEPVRSGAFHALQVALQEISGLRSIETSPFYGLLKAGASDRNHTDSLRVFIDERLQCPAPGGRRSTDDRDGPGPG